MSDNIQHAPPSYPPVAQRLDADLRSMNAGDETTGDSVSSVQAARDKVRSAQERLRHDLTQVSQVGEVVVRDVWTKAKPVLVIGAAVCGAIVVYRMFNRDHHRPHGRPLARLDYAPADRERSSRIPSLVRSVAISVGMAVLNRWLHSWSEQPPPRTEDDVPLTPTPAGAVA